MAEGGIYNVVVYLVHDHGHAVFAADIAQPPQLLLAPDAADRVMRRADDDGLRPLRLFRQIVKIHDIASVFRPQRVFHQRPAGVDHRRAKREIHRRLDDHAVPRLRQRADRLVQPAHNAVHRHDPFRLYRPAVAATHPVRDGAVKRAARKRVAVHAVLCPLDHGLHQLRRREKLHIRHGEGDIIRAGERPVLQLRPFPGVHAPAQPERVKIVFHSVPSCRFFPMVSRRPASGNPKKGRFSPIL